MGSFLRTPWLAKLIEKMDLSKSQFVELFVNHVYLYISMYRYNYIYTYISISICVWCGCVSVYIYGTNKVDLIEKFSRDGYPEAGKSC